MTADPAPLVYAAHPMTTYGTPREARALARMAELVPDTRIINPATRYRNTSHWQLDWPRLIPQMTALIVFCDKDGAIGTGCLHELTDAWYDGIPVAMLDDQGECRHVDGIRGPLRRGPDVPADWVPGAGATMHSGTCLGAR